MNAINRRNFDTLTPEFRLHINGSPAPQALKADISSVRILEDVDAAGMFSFTLLCWDGARMQTKWIDDKLFEVGNPVEIEMGYRDRLKSLFQGEITGLEPAFPGDAPPTLTVRGHDRRHRLMRRRNTRTFLNMKDSDIANQIAAEWGLTPRTTDTGVSFDYVLQNNQTDFIFLQQRARRIGFELVVSDKTLHFRPRRNSGKAALTLNREVELLDFRARLSSVQQVEEMTVQGWDPRNKKAIAARSQAGDEDAMGEDASGPAVVGRVFGQTGSTTVQHPVATQAEADQLARGRLTEMALGYMDVRGECIGRTDLRSGIRVEIQGLGRRFSGIYYILETEHVLDPRSGYRTTFKARRNAT
jgi:uncharacterized protein